MRDGRGLSGVLSLAIIALSVLLIAYHLSALMQPLTNGITTGGTFADFKIYLCGGRHMATPYESCTGPEAVSGFVYPPPAILYMVGLGALSDDAAFRLHTLFSVIFLGTALAMLVAMEPSTRRFGWLAPVLASLAVSPIVNSLYAGQVNIMIMAACVISVWAATNRRWFMAGLSTACGFWFKLYPIAILGLFFVNRAKRPAILSSVACVLVIAVISLIWIPVEFYPHYFFDLVPHLQEWTQPGAAFSIAGLAEFLRSGADAPVYHFVPIPPAIRLISTTALLAGFGVAAFHQYATRDDCPVESLGILLAVMLITSPNAWNYHYALVLPLIFVSIERVIAAPHPARVIIVLLSWFAFVIPGWSVFPDVMSGVRPLRILFYARYEIAALLLAGMVVHARRHAWRTALAELPREVTRVFRNA